MDVLGRKLPQRGQRSEEDEVGPQPYDPVEAGCSPRLLEPLLVVRHHRESTLHLQPLHGINRVADLLVQADHFGKRRISELGRARAERPLDHVPIGDALPPPNVPASIHAFVARPFVDLVAACLARWLVLEDAIAAALQRCREEVEGRDCCRQAWKDGVFERLVRHVQGAKRASKYKSDTEC